MQFNCTAEKQIGITMKKILDKLEIKYGEYAIPNLVTYLVSMQFICYIYVIYLKGSSQNDFLNMISLVPAGVIKGEVWRLFSFVIIPPGFSLLSLLALYMLYFMGNSLEAHWGTFKFNLFFLSGYFFTVVASFLLWNMPMTNVFWITSIFLAFAYSYPDFEFFIFFVLPVKVKYLAWFTWFGFAFVLLFAPWSERIALLASIANFLMFFGKNIYHTAKYGHKKMVSHAKQVKESKKAFHKCNHCGITEHDDDYISFRFSSIDGEEYCENHLNKPVIKVEK